MDLDKGSFLMFGMVCVRVYCLKHLLACSNKKMFATARFHLSGCCSNNHGFLLYHRMTVMSSLILEVDGNSIVNNGMIADTLILSY